MGPAIHATKELFLNMNASTLFKGLLAGLAATAIAGTALAQGTPPSTTNSKDPATAAGQQSTQSTPMGSTGNSGSTGASTMGASGSTSASTDTSAASTDTKVATTKTTKKSKKMHAK